MVDKKNIMIILGTAHLGSTAGKRSPDGRLREAIYSREIVEEVEAKLLGYGYNVTVDYRPLEENESMRAVSKSLNQQNRELIYRARQVNKMCDKFGAMNCLYVCVHVDAAGMGDRWYGATGWSVRVSPKASSRSKTLANCLWTAAESHGLKMRKPKTDQKYYEQSLYVLNQTKCPAVLTENLFQDNKDDVEFLLSDEGRHAIERAHVEGIIKYLNIL